MQGINESGQLSDEDEKTLGDAIAEAIDDFGPDFDEEGNALEEGESDRVARAPRGGRRRRRGRGPRLRSRRGTLSARRSRA